MACSQIPMTPGEQPLRPGWEWLNAVLDVPLYSVIVGGLIGAGVNWLFASQSSRELRAEAARLHAETVAIRQAVNVLGQAMEQAGWATLARNPDGVIIGITLTRSAPATASLAYDTATGP